MNTPIITIGLVSKNSGNVILKSIDSIVQNNTTLNYELLIVDNDSTDNTLLTVNQTFPDVKIIANPKNFGLSFALNQIINISESEYILFMSPGIIARNHTIEKLLSYLETNKNIAAVVPKFLNSAGSFTRVNKRLPTPTILFLENSFIGRLFTNSPLMSQYKMKTCKLNREIKVESPSLDFLLIRKESLLKIGSFDSCFLKSFADIDLFRRLKINTDKIFVYPTSTVIYQDLGSLEKDNLEFFLAMFQFLKKHYGKTTFYIFKLTILIDFIIKTITDLLKTLFRKYSLKDFIKQIKMHLKILRGV